MAKQTKQFKQNLVKSLQNVNNVAYMGQLDENRWLLEFVEGSFKVNEAWFIKTPEGDEFIALPQQVLNSLINNLQNHHEEKLLILLRHEIKELMPIDLEDTMVVAIHELDKYKGNNGNLHAINVKEFAKRIKAAHPNLFLHLDKFFNL